MIVTQYCRIYNVNIVHVGSIVLSRSLKKEQNDGCRKSYKITLRRESRPLLEREYVINLCSINEYQAPRGHKRHDTRDGLQQFRVGLCCITLHFNSCKLEVQIT